MARLSLIVPCYNEAGNLPDLVGRARGLRHELPEAEIILVDNGSTDDSPRVFRELLGGGDASLRLLRVEKNQGYGHGILAGLAEARGEYLAWTHADLQTDLMDVARAWRALQASPDPGRTLVKGRRRGRSPFDAGFTWGMSLLSSAALGTPVSDVNAQPKVFSRALYARFAAPPQDFSLDLYLLWLARTSGHAIATIPVLFGRRLHGEAKGGGGGSLRTRLKLIDRTWRYIFRLRSRVQGLARA